MTASHHLFFELSHDLFCVAQDDRFIEVNPAWTRHLGWTREELICRPYLDFVHPEDIAATNEARVQLQNGLSVLKFENRYRAKQGEYKWLQWNATVTPTGIVATARDVTEQKQQATLLKSSVGRTALFQSLIQGTNDPVYLISPREGFRFTYVNDALCRHFRLSREALLRMAIPDWDPNFTMADCDQLWREVQKEKLRIIETAHKIGEGHEVPVEVTINYLEIGNEAYLGGYVKNIEERKALEENLERFAYAASHDLQEPLRTISSYLTLIERKAPKTEDISEYIGFAVDAAERMRNLIRALLEYSKLGRSKAGLVPFQLGLSVENAIRNLKAMLDYSEVEIVIDPLPVVLGDSLLFTQLFQNLIENAVKYRREESLHIHIGGERHGTEWVVFVKDNGIGIAQEFSERIFDFFQRLHSHVDIPGAGIGLAACKKIVEMHSGRIWVEPGESQGSSFLFTIPTQEALLTERANGQ